MFMYPCHFFGRDVLIIHIHAPALAIERPNDWRLDGKREVKRKILQRPDCDSFWTDTTLRGASTLEGKWSIQGQLVQISKMRIHHHRSGKRCMPLSTSHWNCMALDCTAQHGTCFCGIVQIFRVHGLWQISKRTCHAEKAKKNGWAKETFGHEIHLQQTCVCIEAFPFGLVLCC